jgi:hypothetical protein
MAEDLAGVKRVIQRAAIETARRAACSRTVLEEARKALERPVWKPRLSDQSGLSSNVVPIRPKVDEQSAR